MVREEEREKGRGNGTLREGNRNGEGKIEMRKSLILI